MWISNPPHYKSFNLVTCYEEAQTRYLIVRILSRYHVQQKQKHTIQHLLKNKFSFKVISPDVTACRLALLLRIRETSIRIQSWVLLTRFLAHFSQEHEIHVATRY